jgi:hypothetical protein
VWMLFTDLRIILLLYIQYAEYKVSLFWFHKNKNMPCSSQACFSVTKCRHIWYLLSMTVLCELQCLYMKVSCVSLKLSHYLHVLCICSPKGLPVAKGCLTL